MDEDYDEDRKRRVVRKEEEDEEEDDRRRPPIKKLRILLKKGDPERAANLLMSLPGEIRVNLASYLSFQDIVNLTSVNKDFRIWSNQTQMLWPMLFQRNIKDFTLGAIITILQAAFPQVPVNYSHNNYKTLTLAVAAVKMNRTEFRRGNNELIRVNPASIARKKADNETDDIQLRKIIVALVGKKDVKTNTGTSWFYAYTGNATDFAFVTGLMRIAAAFHVIRAGYMTNFFSNAKPLITSRVCVKCGDDSVKFRLEPGNLVFCSKACGKQYVQ